MATRRFISKTWLDLGFAALKTNGISALTIEALCNQANKTRGSFYFHFTGIDEFLMELANEWKLRFTNDIVSWAPKSVTRFDVLNLLVARLDLPLESGIRQLAVVNPNIRTIVGLADQERIDWLAQLYRKSSFANDDIAEELAEIEYSAFVGFRLIKPEMESAEAKRMYDSFLRITGRTEALRS